MEFIYIEIRDRLIDEILNNVKIAYPKDQQMLSGVIDLTVNLQMVAPDEGVEFVQDMWGFRMWCAVTKNTDRTVLTTFIHDLGEFSKNRKEAWFCPRTSGYRKYL